MTVTNSSGHRDIMRDPPHTVMAQVLHPLGSYLHKRGSYKKGGESTFLFYTGILGLEVIFVFKRDK